VVTTAVATGEQALATLEEQPFDCMILDLGLPDMGGIEVLKRIKKQPKFADLPVVIYTSKDLSRSEETQLKKFAATIITKNADSADRLLEETSLFLHRVLQLPEGDEAFVEEAPPVMPNVSPTPIAAQADGTAPVAEAPLKKRGKRKPAKPVPTGEQSIEGRSVLVVDDDMRNIFALTSVLETHGVTVSFAENGRDCLQKLEEAPVDMVLMDVMMPEMDGYETMQAIRKKGLDELPIIALTAKAMAGDREKCLEAGASDYITKPVDVDALLTLMRRWMPARVS
jgi:CheY-like chemotaxis protein